jgi:transposase
MGGHRPFAISGEHRLFVLRQIEETPHVTLQALSEALAARGLNVHPATVGRLLARERKSFKKNRSARRTGPA